MKIYQTKPKPNQNSQKTTLKTKSNALRYFFEVLRALRTCIDTHTSEYDDINDDMMKEKTKPNQTLNKFLPLPALYCYPFSPNFKSLLSLAWLC